MEDSEEIWKDIPDYQGIYQASSYGRIRSLPRMIKSEGVIKHRELKGRILSQYKRGDKVKYDTVILSISGNKIKVPVHQLVLKSFHGNRPTSTHVARHLDDDEANNRPENLAWGTQSQNMKDKFNNGYVHHGKLLSDHQRNAIRDDNRSQRVIAKEYGVSQKTIFRVKRKSLR